MTIENVRGLILLGVAIALSSCSLFQREPPLPRHAVIEANGTEEKFVRLIQDADIIYFPSEALALTSRSEPAWKLLGALRGSAGSFAIGWDGSVNESERRSYLNEARKAGAEILALNEPSSRGQIEAASTPDELAAEKIASYFREHRTDKVLVFIRRERLGLVRGVPYLVAQQTKARQLILNPRKSASGAQLLARN